MIKIKIEIKSKWFLGAARIAVGTVMVGFASMGVPAEKGAGSLLERSWIEARTAHFNIYSCGAVQDVSKVAARLEQFRQVYSSLAGAEAVASPPIAVMYFASTSFAAGYVLRSASSASCVLVGRGVGTGRATMVDGLSLPRWHV